MPKVELNLFRVRPNLILFSKPKRVISLPVTDYNIMYYSIMYRIIFGKAIYLTYSKYESTSSVFGVAKFGR